MKNITIEQQNGKLIIKTPYNAEFVKRIKKFGNAKWNGSAWTVDEAFLQPVREVLLEIYGYTDIDENTKTVTLKISTPKAIYADKTDIIMFGKTIASARGRDSGARTGEDIAFIEGGATSGGSVKNWETVIKENSTFIVKNVVETLYLAQKDDDFYKDMQIQVLVPQENHLNKREQLEKEREQLLKRLEKIEEELKAL